MSEKEYDVIINIDSIRFLKDKGWKITYKGDEKTKNNIKDIIENSKRNIVSILGNSNRGKTYLLQRISGVQLKSGYQDQTKGLSIKIPNNSNSILLDTAGTNAPLLLDENDTEPKTQKEIDKINLCQILTNYIIQTFVINQAHIIMCVINQLTASEQQFLNKIKIHCKNQKKRLIVIHNLIDLANREEIEEYIKETFWKDIFNKYSSKLIPEPGKKKKNDFHKFFIENEDKSKEVEVAFDIRHFIFGNDEKNEEIKYYNDSTLEYIRNYISTQNIKPVKLIEKLRNHIQEISKIVLSTELESITKSKDLELIQCSENFEPKEIVSDPLDNIIFIGKEYEPSFRIYVEEDKLVIEIEICSKLVNKVNVKNKFDPDTKETFFKISGERLLNEKKEEKIEVIHEFINKRNIFQKFKLELSIKLFELDIRSISFSNYTEEIKDGILFLGFKIKKRI